jgi:hypothetical protein
MIRITVTYDTTRPQRALGAYRVEMRREDGPEAPLRSAPGPTIGNVARSVGRYASEAQAARAAADYIGRDCMIVEHVDADTGHLTGRYEVMRPAKTRHRVLATTQPA